MRNYLVSAIGFPMKRVREVMEVALLKEREIFDEVRVKVVIS